MDEDEFIEAVKARLRTEEDLYETMLRDTYQNGIVLARRKYRYLAYAYRLFVVGLTLTFLAFAAEMAMAWMGCGGTRRGDAGRLLPFRHPRPAFLLAAAIAVARPDRFPSPGRRAEENTFELQSLIRISYAVFSLKKKNH